MHASLVMTNINVAWAIFNANVNTGVQDNEFQRKQVTVTSTTEAMLCLREEDLQLHLPSIV